MKKLKLADVQLTLAGPITPNEWKNFLDEVLPLFTKGSFQVQLVPRFIVFEDDEYSAGPFVLTNQNAEGQQEQFGRIIDAATWKSDSDRDQALAELNDAISKHIARAFAEENKSNGHRKKPRARVKKPLSSVPDPKK